MLGATVLAEFGAVALSWGLEPWTDSALYLMFSIGIAGAGALVASAHPRNAIGWLMLWLGASNAVLTDLPQGYGLRAHDRGWPAGATAEWLSGTSVVAQMTPTILMFLLFPTGRMLGRRWNLVTSAGLIGSLVGVGGYMLSDRSDGDFVGGSNPLVVDGLPSAPMWVVGNVLIVTALVGAAASLVVRFRRAGSVERQQIKLLSVVAALSVVVLPISPFLSAHHPWVRVLVALVVLGQPIAICVAILRHRLYDIDRVISRTVSYSVVTAVLLGVYGLTVVALGALVGRSSAWVTAGATLVVAAAFRPVRARAQAIIDRRFDRSRVDAIGLVEAFVDDVRAGRAAPERVEQVLRDVTGDPSLTIHHRREGSAAAADAAAGAIPVRRGGAVVATITGGSALAERRSLVGDVVEAAAMAVEIAGLRAELRHQLDEVEASRARLVLVADEERRRLERDLHDGAQQRLVSIGLALRHAQHQMRRDDHSDASRTLDGAVAEIAVAIDELRELANGLRPSSLDAGLGSALRDLAKRAPLPVTVDTAVDRVDADAETTAYFVASEAITNAVKHAHATRVLLRADRHDGTLVVHVADDGIGGATPRGGSGLRGLADRLAAVGGTLTIDSGRAGTTVIASIPCES